MRFALHRAVEARVAVAIALALALPPLAHGCGRSRQEEPAPLPAEQAVAARPEETHLQGVTLLTRDGSSRQPLLSPDGTRIAYLHRPLGRPLFGLWVMDADGGGGRALLPDSALCEGLCWSEDGLQVLHAATLEPRRGREGPPPDMPAYLDLLYEPGLDLWLVDLESGARTAVLERPGSDADPSYGPGQRILCSSFDGERGVLWATGPGGGEPDSLLSWPGYLGGARTSPDGRWIVFQAARQSDPPGVGLFVCAADGAGARPLFEGGTFALTPAWLPHEDGIAFASDAADQDFELWVVKLDGTGLQRVTHRPGPDLYPCFSRDGKQIVWAGSAGGAESGLRVMRANWIP